MQQKDRLKTATSCMFLTSAVRVVFALFISFSFALCTRKTEYEQAVENPKTILKNLTSFLIYRQRNVQLYKDFKAVDESSKQISKEKFLQFLSSGEYLPLRLESTNTTAIYQLYKVDKNIDREIKTTLKYWGLEEYEHYQAKGKPLPDFHFIDMDGKIYTKQTTKGKILVLKCWFVGCLPCVQEMPALNALKQQYKQRTDILFVSLCLDSPKKVAYFLKKTKFDYATVPDQTAYLEDTLKINSYPTHFVINKMGFITKKVNSYQGVAYALSKEL